MSSHPEREWPDLPSVGPALVEELPPSASPIQLARIFGAAFLAYGALWRKVVQALEYLRAAVDRIERGQRMGSVRPPPATPRGVIGFDPEQTMGGGRHVSSGQWAEVLDRVAELDAELEAAKLEKLTAAAHAAGVAEAFANLEKARKGRRDLVLFILALLVPAGGVVGWFLRHFWP